MYNEPAKVTASAVMRSGQAKELGTGYNPSAVALIQQFYIVSHTSDECRQSYHKQPQKHQTTH